MESEASGRRPSLGHMALVVGVLAYILWYAWDAWGASARVQNLVLIVPLAGLACIFSATLIWSEIREPAQPAKEGLSDDPRQALLLLGLLGLYVAAMPFAGFDLATFLYAATTLVVLGERRIAAVAGYGVGFSIFVVGGMGQLVSMPDMYLLGWMLP